MAVHERHYRPYAGSLTPAWSRFTVLPRYALKGIFASRFYLGAFLASFVWPLGCAVVRSAARLELDQMIAGERAARGIGVVFKCGIKRSDQGGYGSFEPATIV